MTGEWRHYRKMTDAPDDSTPTASLRDDFGFHVGPALVAVISLTIVAIEPALAQAANPVCEDSSGTLVTMAEGFLRITTGLGVMGLLMVWQADALVEMFTLNRDQKERLKRHKLQAAKSALVLIILGPLFTVAGSIMGLPVASCVDLVPF